MDRLDPRDQRSIDRHPVAFRTLPCSLPPAVSVFLKDGRFIIYGVLIVLGTVFFAQGLITPALWERRRKAPPPAAARPEETA